MGFFQEVKERIENMSDEEFMNKLREVGLEDYPDKQEIMEVGIEMKGELSINDNTVYFNGEPLIAEIEGEFNGNSLKEDLLQVLDKHDYAYENAKRYAIFIRKSKDKPEIKVDF